MAAEIPNLVKRNGIYYFRCRIPSNLTNGRAREVKISLKTGDLTSDLLDVILKVTDYSRRVIAESLETYNKGGANDMNIVTEIRNRITQYINTKWLTRKWNSPSSEVTITPSASATTICANTTAFLKTTA